MSTQQRDPRRDPRPGDRLKKDGHATQLVARRGKHTVVVCDMIGFRPVKLETWRVWARNATVLHAAPDASGPGSGARTGQDGPPGEGA